MQDPIDRAIEAVKKLPDAAQRRIGRSMLDAVTRYHQLNEALVQAEAELDAGQGIPAQDVVNLLSQRYGA